MHCVINSASDLLQSLNKIFSALFFEFFVFYYSNKLTILDMDRSNKEMAKLAKTKLKEILTTFESRTDSSLEAYIEKTAVY